eukprot:TRINITY_DN18518_c0_g1_i1.p1 TRINITY_DN18518_c0_g1~~TRINITY_DN18518_c0_g1_i1.p1  ORF type:complete len:299 (+),score=48.59 TRINITY_DN18518_c0_g1_i1:50-898(+)
MPVIACCGDSNMGSPLSRGNKIAHHVSAAFSEKAHKVDAMAFGASGATAVAGKHQYCKLKIFKKALTLEPMVLVLSLGTNDAYGKFPLSQLKGKFTIEMNKILDQVEREVPDCTVLLLPALGCKDTRISQQRLEMVQEACTEIGRERSLHVIDTPELGTKDYERDKVHLTKAGCKKVAELVVTAVQQVVDFGRKRARLNDPNEVLRAQLTEQIRVNGQIREHHGQLKGLVRGALLYAQQSMSFWGQGQQQDVQMMPAPMSPRGFTIQSLLRSLGAAVNDEQA